MKNIKSFFTKNIDSLVDGLYEEMSDSHNVSREEFGDIINCILYQKNFAIYGYDNLKHKNTNAFCFIKDDKDKVFLDVISEYTKSIKNE